MLSYLDLRFIEYRAKKKKLLWTGARKYRAPANTDLFLQLFLKRRCLTSNLKQTSTNIVFFLFS